MAISCLCQQLQLFGRYRFIRVLAASGVWTGFLEESLYKWESYMSDLCRMNECRICSPIEPCDWPCDEARGKRKQLVDQCQAVSFLNHPLNLRGSACHTGKMDGNPYFGKHLDQSGMSRWMQFRISEYGDPRRSRSLLWRRSTRARSDRSARQKEASRKYPSRRMSPKTCFSGDRFPRNGMTRADVSAARRPRIRKRLCSAADLVASWTRATIGNGCCTSWLKNWSYRSSHSKSSGARSQPWLKRRARSKTYKGS